MPIKNIFIAMDIISIFQMLFYISAIMYYIKNIFAKKKEE